MTPAEAATYARVSEARVKGWIADRLLAVVPLAERKAGATRGREDVIIERADLDEFLRGRKRRPQSATVEPVPARDKPKKRRAAAGSNEEFLRRIKGEG